MRHTGRGTMGPVQHKGEAMAAFKQCDGCGRTVGWNDTQERRTWLELHWDVIEDDHPEQVWDFCSWDCVVTFTLARRRGPVGDLVRDLGERLLAAGVTQEDYLAAIERERERTRERLVTSQDVRSLLEQLDRPNGPRDPEPRWHDAAPG
jgi:hypothetical protein